MGTEGIQRRKNLTQVRRKSKEHKLMKSKVRESYKKKGMLDINKHRWEMKSDEYIRECISF